MTALRRSSLLWLVLVGWQLLTATAVYLRHCHQGGTPTHHHHFSFLGSSEVLTQGAPCDGEPVDHTHYIFLGIEFFFAGDHQPQPRPVPDSGSVVHGLIDGNRSAAVAPESVLAVDLLPAAEPESKLLLETDSL